MPDNQSPEKYALVEALGAQVHRVKTVPYSDPNHFQRVAGRIGLPGAIDAHVHGDLMLFVDSAHEPAVRQGVTTYVVGQDGVAFAPASADTMRYMKRYTAGFNGNFDTPGKTLLDQIAKVVHCSAGNYRRFGDAIQETGPAVFARAQQAGRKVVIARFWATW